MPACYYTYKNIQWPEIIVLSLRMPHLRHQNFSKVSDHITSRSSFDSLIGIHKGVRTWFCKPGHFRGYGSGEEDVHYLFSYPGLTHFNFNLLNRFSPWIFWLEVKSLPTLCARGRGHSVTWIQGKYLLQKKTDCCYIFTRSVLLGREGRWWRAGEAPGRILQGRSPEPQRKLPPALGVTLICRG